MTNLAPTAYNLFENKKYKQAIHEFERELEKYNTITPRPEEYYQLSSDMAVAMTMANKTSKAIKLLDTILTYYTDNEDTYHIGIVSGNLAVAYEKSRNSKTAISYYQKAAQCFNKTNHPAENYHCQYSLALLYMKTGEKFKAISALNSALEINPNASIKDRALKRLMNMANLS